MDDDDVSTGRKEEENDLVKELLLGISKSLLSELTEGPDGGVVIDSLSLLISLANTRSFLFRSLSL